MDESEFSELLRFIQERVATAGLGELNERIISELRMTEAPSSWRAILYLDILRDELSLGTHESTVRVLRRLRNVATREHGRPIDGIEIAMTQGDAEIYGTDVVDLSGLPDLGDLLQDLSRLAGHLRESGAGGWG